MIFTDVRRGQCPVHPVVVGYGRSAGIVAMVQRRLTRRVPIMIRTAGYVGYLVPALYGTDCIGSRNVKVWQPKSESDPRIDLAAVTV